MIVPAILSVHQSKMPEGPAVSVKSPDIGTDNRYAHQKQTRENRRVSLLFSKFHGFLFQSVPWIPIPNCDNFVTYVTYASCYLFVMINLTEVTRPHSSGVLP